MNLAEKTLIECCAEPTYHDCFLDELMISGYRAPVDKAMRSIAWEAWKENLRDVYGDYVSTSDDDKKKFEEWYDKQIK